MTTTDPTDYRDKGLDYLEKGKDTFNKHQAVDQRQKGYELYKNGLEFIIKYLKTERNPVVVNKIKENLKVWIDEAKTMENTLVTIKKNTQYQKSVRMGTSVNTRQGNHLSTINKENQTNNYGQQINHYPNPNKQNIQNGPQQYQTPWQNVPQNQTPKQYQQQTPQNNQTGQPQPQPQSQPQSQSNSSNEASSNTKTENKKKEKVQTTESAKLAGNIESAIVSERPNVKWDDIAGLEQAKKSLQEAVIYPIKFPNLFVGMRQPWKGILLYGPPGTGKTYLAKACATEADATFFSVSAADVTSKYVGESEKLIKTLFKMARQKKPSIIFIDEIDSMLSARSDNENEASRRVKTEFLIQMQGVGHNDTGILVLGATNIPWALDTAVRRRFEKRIYIPLPEQSARLALLQKQMQKTPQDLTEEDLVYLASRTEGFSGADMNILVRDASYEPLRKAQNATHFKQISTLPDGKPVYQPCAPSNPEGQRMSMLSIPGEQLTLPPITIEDFEVSLMKIKPSVSEKDITKQLEFTRDFGIEG